MSEARMRLAAQADIPIVADFRRRMFEEMDVIEGLGYNPEELRLMEAVFVQHLLAHLNSEDLICWVMEVEGRVIASAAVSVLNHMPGPGRLDMRWALLHNVYTEPDFRGQGYARRLVEEAIAWTRSQGFGSLALNASQEGRPLYEKLGFHATNQMSLKL